MRRGLDRGYVSEEEETRHPRGRLLLAPTIQRQLVSRGQVACSYDELSYDVLHNKILATTLDRLALEPLDKEVHAALVGVRRHLPEIGRIALTRGTFRRVQLHRNNAFYGFLLRVCELLFDRLLPDPAPGQSRFRSFLEDDDAMARLFENFVRNFYRRHLPEFQVGSEQLAWDFVPVDSASEGWLPIMRTDITLHSPGRTIIIDTKYYRSAVQERFGTKKVKSENLYQLFAYLENAAKKGGSYAEATGILLYPQTGETLNLGWQKQGRTMQVRTIDLGRPWQEVREGLLGIAEGARGAPSTALPR